MSSSLVFWSTIPQTKSSHNHVLCRVLYRNRTDTTNTNIRERLIDWWYDLASPTVAGNLRTISSPCGWMSGTEAPWLLESYIGRLKRLGCDVSKGGQVPQQQQQQERCTHWWEVKARRQKPGPLGSPYIWVKAGRCWLEFRVNLHTSGIPRGNPNRDSPPPHGRGSILSSWLNHPNERSCNYRQEVSTQSGQLMVPQRKRAERIIRLIWDSHYLPVMVWKKTTPKGSGTIRSVALME